MLLSDLYKLHDELVKEGRLMPAGFKRAQVHFLVDLDHSGQVVAVTSLFDTKGRGTPRVVPDSSRTANDYAHLVCDGLDYVAGLPESIAKVGQAANRHDLYLRRLQECAATLGGRSAELLNAVTTATRNAGAFQQILVLHGASVDLGVFGNSEPSAAQDKQFAAQSKWFVDFRVEGEPILPEINGSVGDEAIVRWWTLLRAREDASEVDGLCQVAHTVGPLARLFPATKLPGNQPKLVSANFDAALRYGAEQSGGARVSSAVAVGATQALNWLIEEARDRHRWSFKDLTLTWWTADDLDADPLAELLGTTQRDPGAVTASIRQPVWSGRPRLSRTSGFHVALLTVNSARVVVLADHHSTLGEVQDQIDRWFESLAPVRRLRPTWSLGVRELADASCGPGKHQDKPRGRAATLLLRYALFGNPLPLSLRDQVVGRCSRGYRTTRGDRRHVSPAQAAVLHLVAASWKENPLARTPAELCGRIFAVLEETQEQALGSDINRGVISYYGAAASTPQLAFPRLVGRRNAHLRKLRRDRPGAAVHVDRKLGMLMSELQELGGFPQRLTPAGQSQFALGYFHERQARFTRSDNTEQTPTEEELPE